MKPQTKSLPECWGHRGASAAFPENTIASFEAAMRDGAEGIESDVHVTMDNVVVMFHDPDLGRTTDMKAVIRESHWHGEKGIHRARTLKAPHQPIPTFTQTVDLLMKPENLHVKFNVDVKVQNDPDRLFRLMHETISSHPNWETKLAPRILLGLWHPKFIQPAKTHLKYLRRSHIGMSPQFARTWFWDNVEVFSMSFACLATADGEAFRNECKRSGKSIMVWTVNAKEEMMQSVLWELDVILTDRTRDWLDLRAQLAADFHRTAATAAGSRLFLWSNWEYYWPIQFVRSHLQTMFLIKIGGPLQLDQSSAAPVTIS